MTSRLDNCFRNSTTGVETGALIYIAGPISGNLPDHLPRFFEAEKALNAAGHSTFNPARADGGRSAGECIRLAHAAKGRRTWTDYMRQGIAGLIRCNGIALLKGYDRSAGARLEQHIAGTLGYDFYDAFTGRLTFDGRPQAAVPEYFKVSN